ncbi:hypothetical protein LXT12_26090 [Pelomonas sp. P7]|uniref:Uncharacterized protein n=1 Tax=Pelomonas caseinilytica TaxID=2906763 RepID=A0ABS8XIM1_9BURK|nr:hypothetical protein [Pelomonas sp. P7]MCE4540709.1 hypothetical protein [Pelomonas sp. P7]
MQHRLIAIVFALTATFAGAQQGQSGAANTPAQAVTKATTAAPSSTKSGAAAANASAVAQPSNAAASAALTPQADSAALAQALANLELAVSRVDGKLPSPWWATPATTLLSVLIGGLISALAGWRLQARLLKHQGQQAIDQATRDEKLADKKANHEARQVQFDWHVRQFIELYGPLRALFDGSNRVYRLMNDALISRDPKRFRDAKGIVPAQELDPDERLFQIYDESHKDKWRKFRTVTDLDVVYGHGLGVDGYFDRLIEIGNSISKLIGEKAGLVMPHHGELLTAFGQYLAHFEVLKELHALSRPAEAGSNATVRPPLEVRDTAAFPNSIQRLVKTGADELLRKLADGPGSSVKA